MAMMAYLLVPLSSFGVMALSNNLIQGLMINALSWGFGGATLVIQ